jgi:copper transport protein
VKPVVLCVVLVALLAPATASAHATLRSTSPHFGRELSGPPLTIRLRFDQHVRLLPDSVRVLDRTGTNRARAAHTDGRSIVTPLRRLRRGAYTVRWHAISADSHVVSGVWTFGVGVPAPAVSNAYGAGGPTRAEHLVRWIWFLGLALAIGTLGLRLIVLRGLAVPPQLERRIAVTAGVGVLVSLHAGIAAFSLRSDDALQLPFARFLYADLSPMAATRFGRAFVVMTLGFALVLALVYLSWLLERVAYLVPAFALATVLVSGLSLSGHDAADAGSSWKTELADWVHLVAASLWLGGLATLVALVWFGAPALRRRTFARFSRLATVLVAVVVGAGTYLSIVRLPQLSDLWTTGYGHVLLVKLGLVTLALCWGAFHHFAVGPLVSRADDGVLSRIGGSLAAESLVGVAVLLAAAVLVDSRPPQRPIGTSDRPSQAPRAAATLDP